jgi:hypothetical protein
MFSGKCSRCNVIKADFEEEPKPYDLLLCNMCYDQVSKNAQRDHMILQLIEELTKHIETLKTMLS